MIHVILPAHLRTLANIDGEVHLDVSPPATAAKVIDGIEERYPALKGTIREHQSRKRRAFLRFYACGEDISHEPADAPLPQAVACGREPFMVIGSVAGG